MLTSVVQVTDDEGLRQHSLLDPQLSSRSAANVQPRQRVVAYPPTIHCPQQPLSDLTEPRPFKYHASPVAPTSAAPGQPLDFSSQDAVVASLRVSSSQDREDALEAQRNHGVARTCTSTHSGAVSKPQEMRDCPLCLREHPKKSYSRDVRAHYTTWICREPRCNKSYNRKDFFVRHHKSHGCQMENCCQIAEAEVIADEWEDMVANGSMSGLLPDMDVEHRQGNLNPAEMDQEHGQFEILVSRCQNDNTVVAALRRMLHQPRYAGVWHEVLIEVGRSSHGTDPLADLSDVQAQAYLDSLQTAPSLAEALRSLYWTAFFDCLPAPPSTGSKRRQYQHQRSQRHSFATATDLLSLRPSAAGPASTAQVLLSTIDAASHPMSDPGPSLKLESRRQNRPNSERRGVFVGDTHAPSMNDELTLMDSTDHFAFYGSSPNQRPKRLEPPMDERRMFDQDVYSAMRIDYQPGQPSSNSP